jgi:hypothetical protein
MYTIETFEELGKSLLISILDIKKLNPVSRVFSTPFKTIDVNIY